MKWYKKAGFLFSSWGVSLLGPSGLWSEQSTS